MTPARAVEVAAVFEDSVIAVKHLTDSRTPDPRVTQALLIGGGLSLMGALGSFIASVHQVGVLRRAHEAAVAAHHASGPFVLPSGGRWLDFVVALCVVAGTWALFAGAGRWLAARRSRNFIVGPSPLADLNAPLDSDRPLVIAGDQGWMLEVAEPMRGEMSQGSDRPLALAVPSRIPISEGTRAFIDIGALRFVVGASDVPSRMATPLRINWSQEAYIGAVGMLAGIFLGLLYLIPPDPKSLSIDSIHSDLVAHYIIKAPEPPEAPALKTGNPGSGGGRAHAGRSGSMGNPKVSPDKRGKATFAGKSPDPKIGRAAAERAAENAGVLGVMSAFEQSHIGSIFTRESALGPDAENVMGNLIAADPGEGFGKGGMGIVGDGPGGGGHDTTTIGVGNLPRIGPGGPGRNGKYPPGGTIGLPNHKVRTVEPFGKPEIKAGAGLSKDLIKRVVHSHHNEIKFCYEKRLLVKQGLGGGRVLTRFIIAGNGRVLSSGIEATTLNDKEVETCIAEAVRRWDFPRPSDGSMVSVVYPFVLQAPAGAQ